MTCLHNHDEILEFLRKIFLKGFQIYQNYLCALIYFVEKDKQKQNFTKMYTTHIFLGGFVKLYTAINFNRCL